MSCHLFLVYAFLCLANEGYAISASNSSATPIQRLLVKASQRMAKDHPQYRNIAIKKIALKKENKNKKVNFFINQNGSLVAKNKLESKREKRNAAKVLEKIANKKKIWPVKIPFEENTFEFLKSKGRTPISLAKNFESAYPLMHEDAVQLAAEYLKLKAQTSRFYEKMDLTAFLHRLVTKRAVFSLGHGSFVVVAKRDGKYVRLDSADIKSDYKDKRDLWALVGTDDYKGPFKLHEVLTADDIRLSSLISFSSRTIFLNAGERSNRARYYDDPDLREMLHDEGVSIGVVGPRFSLWHELEYRDFITYPNVAYDTPVDNIFQKYYKSKECDEAVKNLEIVELRNGDEEWKLGFDVCGYYQRIRMTMQKLLIEANVRAKETGKPAYLHIVGFGLGVWQMTDKQVPIFVRAAVKAIVDLESQIPHVSHVRFGYITTDEPPTELPVRIEISYSTNYPHTNVGEDVLLVVTYAYDGNAYPGNEYWKGDTGSTSDPAAACSTQIGETQNPFLNHRMSGKNLRVATRAGKLLLLGDYLRRTQQGTMANFAASRSPTVLQ